MEYSTSADVYLIFFSCLPFIFGKYVTNNRSHMGVLYLICIYFLVMWIESVFLGDAGRTRNNTCKICTRGDFTRFLHASHYH